MKGAAEDNRREGHPEPSFLAGEGARALPAWVAMPGALAPGAVPLVAVHGIGRSARAQALAFAARANAEGRPVIAPEFGEKAWPRYQQAVRGGRADLALLGLLEKLKVFGIAGAERIDLCGYSGGAQFAHRFAMLYPQRVRRLCLVSAGWYTFPDAGAPFPYGLARQAADARAADRSDGCWSSVLARRLPEFLALDIDVCVGGEDTVPDDDNLRRGASLDARQGTTRLERAICYTRALREAAALHGVPPGRIRLHVLPAAGHDFGQCIAAGLAGIVLPHRPPAPGGQCTT